MSADETQAAPNEQLQEAVVVRYEEEAEADKTWRGIGFLRARKQVQTAAVKEMVPRNIEDVDLQRVPVGDGDSGQIETLPDGSVSIPLFEEELVITRRTVLKERLIIRKHLVTEEQRVETELRKEFVEIDADEGVEVMRGRAAFDEGASRLGEVALVDREGRIGPLGTTFYNTLLDENAASHIALGNAYEIGVGEEDRGRVNKSAIHIDFMIGGNDVRVTGITRDGRDVPVLADGSWQI